MARTKCFVFLLLAQGFILQRAVAQKSALDLRSSVRIHPIKLIDLTSPGLEISAERELARSFSFQVSGTVFSGVLPSFFKRVGGYRVLVSPKFFFKPVIGGARIYVAPEAGWAEVLLSTKREIYHPADTSAGGELLNIVQDRYVVYKQLRFYNFRIGFQARGGRWVLDAAIGAGVKVRSVSHAELDEIPGFLEKHQQASPFNAVAAVREGWREGYPNFPISFSVGYRF